MKFFNVTFTLAVALISATGVYSSEVCDNEDNPDGLIAFESDVNTAGKLTLQTIKANGRDKVSFNNPIFYERPSINLVNNDKTLLFVNKNKRLISLDLSAGSDLQPQKVFNFKGMSDFDYTASSDGMNIVLQTRFRGEGYKLEMVEYFSTYGTWSAPRLIRSGYEHKLVNPTLRADKKVIVYERNSHILSSQLCEINLEHEEDFDDCKDIGPYNPNISVFSISPDAKRVILQHAINRTLKVVEYGTWRPVSCSFRYNYYQIHKWVDDGLYVSFQKVNEDYSMLYKLSFVDGELTKVVDENSESIPVLMD